MTWNLQRPRGRARWAAALTSVLVALTLLGSAPVAHAEGSYDDTGPGNSSDYRYVGGPKFDPDDYACGQNIGKTPLALYVRSGLGWQKHYEAPYPNCDGGASLSGDGRMRLCPVGFEVYRFYGWKGNDTPTAVTRSRLNLTDWCKGEKLYTFPGQTVWDADPSTMPGAPDFVRGYDSPRQSANGYPAMVGRRAETNLLTSTRPVRVIGRCQTVSGKNPVQEWMAKATDREVVSMRISFGHAYQRFAEQGGKTYPKNAAQELGARSITGYRYSKVHENPARKPPRDPNGRNFYANNIVWETDPCATPYNFTLVEDPATGRPIGGVPQVGTCYIPVMRYVKGMSNSAERAWTGQSLRNDGGGERYSTYFRGKSSDPGIPRSWRQAMRADYLKRADRGFEDANGNQLLPAQHHPGENDASKLGVSVGANAAKAAKELANWSRCRFSTQPVFRQPDAPDPVDAEAALRLTVNDRKVLQTGGNRFQATFSVSRSQLLCGAAVPCGSQASLSKLSYSFDLVGLGGYTECRPGQLTGCDYRIVDKQNGSISSDARLVAEFYRATKPDLENVQLRLSGLDAAFKYYVEHTGLTVDGIDPVTGEPYTFTTEPIGEWIEVPFTPTVVGKPVPVTRSGGAYTVTYPVISAVDVPMG